MLYYDSKAVGSFKMDIESGLSKETPDKTSGEFRSSGLQDEISGKPEPDFKPPWEDDSIKEYASTEKTTISIGKGMENVNASELAEAQEYVKDAIDFIRDNAKTDVEKKTVEALDKLAQEGKIIIGDTSYDCGHPVFGFFHPDIDTKTGVPDGYIVLDFDAVLAYGKAETIDTLMHESYHAAQHFAGHDNDMIEEETRAWNIGLDMSNKYRAENGEYIVQAEPYTREDIENKGYLNIFGGDDFTEIAKGNREILA
jgi:hypothetical protein